MLGRKRIINLNPIIMKKNEKLKVLAAVAESLGLTAEAAAAYFGKISVHSEETEEAVSTGVVCPGMYYYSDGTISEEVFAEKQISGVVGWVDDSGQHGLVLGLRETRLPWSGDELEVGAFTESGRENTRLILEAARKQNKKAEAAEWCVAYDFDGICAGEAFLASRDELVKIFKNLDAVQKALKKINRPLLDKYNWYWSSSESYDYDAWSVRPSDGFMNYHYTKDYDNRVRCVLAF